MKPERRVDSSRAGPLALPGTVPEVAPDVAPAAVPADVLAHLNAETVKVLRDPETKQRMSSDGAMPVGSTPAQFAEYMRTEAQKWTKVVKQSDAKAD